MTTRMETRSESDSSVPTNIDSSTLECTTKWNIGPVLDLNYLQCENALIPAPDNARTIDVVLGEIEYWAELRETDRQLTSSQYCWRRVAERAGKKGTGELLPTTAWENQDASDLVHCLAVQLLASCYTTFHTHATLPAAFYTDNPGTLPTDPQLLQSSLRMHSHYLLSPSSGYHARDTTPASGWPSMLNIPSPEERLADELSRRRRQERRASTVGIMEESIIQSNEKIRGFPDCANYLPCGLNSDLDSMQAAQGRLRRSGDGASSDEEDNRQKRGEKECVCEGAGQLGSTKVRGLRDFWSKDSPTIRDFTATSSWETEEDSSATASFLPLSSSSLRQIRVGTGKRKVASPLGRRSLAPESRPSTIANRTSRNGRWSLKPVVKPKPHPLFVQAVKDYEIQRYRNTTRGVRKTRLTSYPDITTGSSERQRRRKYTTRAASPHPEANGEASQSSRRMRATSNPTMTTVSLLSPNPSVARLTSRPSRVATGLADDDSEEIVTNFDSLGAGPLDGESA